MRIVAAGSMRRNARSTCGVTPPLREEKMRQAAFSLTHSFSWVTNEDDDPFNRFNGFPGANGWNRSREWGASIHRDESRC